MSHFVHLSCDAKHKAQLCCREMMISAHQSRIEDLRESFKRKMAQQENTQEKVLTGG